MGEDREIFELWAIKFDGGEFYGHTSREIYAFKSREDACEEIKDHPRAKVIRLKVVEIQEEEQS